MTNTIPTNLIDSKNLPIIHSVESDGCIFTHGYRETTKLTDDSYESIQLFDKDYQYVKENLVGGFDRLPDLQWEYVDVFGKTRSITTLQWIAIDLEGNYCVLRSIEYHGLHETQRDYRSSIVRKALEQIEITKTKQQLIQEHITDFL